MRRLTVVLAALLLAHGISSTEFWADLARALGGEARYKEQRVAHSFWGLEPEAIRRHLADRLRRGESVSLSDDLYNDSFLRQRLTEGWYPRRLEQDSPHVLAMGDEGVTLVGSADAQPPPTGTDGSQPESFGLYAL